MTKQTEARQEEERGFKDLIRLARDLGATQAGAIRAERIVIEDRLAGFCKEPRCPNYGLSINCPPHTKGPAGFRELIKGYEWALVFKIEVPSEIFFSSQRRELFALLQETAAGLEQAAREMGFSRSKGFAGGNCKAVFCEDKAQCRVLAGGECRNPDRARPSMSGFGVDVTRLMEEAGWTLNRVNQEQKRNQGETGTLCGVILIG